MYALWRNTLTVMAMIMCCSSHAELGVCGAFDCSERGLADSSGALADDHLPTLSMIWLQQRRAPFGAC